MVASIAPALNGDVHNVNADTAAAALAVALGAERLVVLTDVEGLYADWPPERLGDQGAVRVRAERADADPGVGHAAQDGGLPPGRRGRSHPATVTDGRVPHALLLEIFTNAGIGTMVTQDGLIRLGSRAFSAADGIPPHEIANGEFGQLPLQPPPPGDRPRPIRNEETA